MRFRCTDCGKCCSSIRGRIEEDEFIANNFFGKMPIVQLVPVERMSLPLWEWEASKLKEKAEELGVDASIKPFRAVFDLAKDESIVISYFLDHDSCPFFSENKCLVYPDRPLVCRQFPIQTVGLSDNPVFASCPAVDGVGLRKDEMKDFFRETYDAAVKNDSIIEYQNRMIMELIKSKKIKPVMDYPYDFLLRRISNAVSRDLFKYLVEENVVDREEIERIIG